MFQIGEFSRLTQVSIRMLRHYDEVGLLEPAYVDPNNGYRFYSVDQIEDLQKIILLRDMDFSISNICLLLKDWEDKSVIQHLSRKKEDVKKEINRQKAKVSKINMAICDIKRDKISVHYNVTVKNIPSCTIISLRENIDNYFCEENLWLKLMSYIEKEGIRLPHPVRNVTIFHDKDHRERDLDVEVALVLKDPIDVLQGFTCRNLERAPKMACIMVPGPYDRIGKSYSSFAFWMEDHHNFKIDGPIRQISHRGPYDGVSCEEYLTEIQVPVIEIGT